MSYVQYNMGRDEPEKDPYREFEAAWDSVFGYTSQPPFAYDTESLMAEYRHLYHQINVNEEEKGHNGIAINVLYVLPRLWEVISDYASIDEEQHKAMKEALDYIMQEYAEFAQQN